MSGINIDGRQIRKGAASAIRAHVEALGGCSRKRLPRLSTTSPGAAAPRSSCATALRVLGVVELKDIVKGGIESVLPNCAAWASRP